MNNFGKKKANNRRYPGIKGRRPDQRVLRQESAQKRLADWQQLTAVEQLRVLDVRLGIGVGAKKQRARLQLLAAAN